jgi:hypothetical protein
MKRSSLLGAAAAAGRRRGAAAAAAVSLMMFSGTEQSKGLFDTFFCYMLLGGKFLSKFCVT